PLFKINIAEQGTSHRVIATHRNLDPNTETVNHKYGNQATNFSSLLGLYWMGRFTLLTGTDSSDRTTAY
ncbi:MAG: hypothetical protein ACK4Y5_18635, partial [Acetobacteraceae bacterium]